ncbi:hypothetical protein [Achromobacter xylosoxidans]|uniref:hypothetical protein n=1 Tax=Alcaligenes xylosoxydans xylosoxydans TaxID=85698 RepID=UPI00292CDC33|nr:hypothetical protein [Achromobacter xylosoxidans]WOB76201.1 hypothetical protein PZA07_12230 [Achromobacter xylosoxidans]
MALMFFARRVARRACLAPLALSVALLAGCASHGPNRLDDIRSEEANPADAVLTLDVTFARAPDYAPRSEQGLAPNRHLAISGYPNIEIPFYQKGLGFELGVLGDPRALLALPYPSPKTDSSTAKLKIFGERLDEKRYRFLVLSRAGWRSLDSFQVAFSINGRSEAMTFAYSLKRVCESRFDVTTPTYGFAMSVAARFAGDKPGCLKACDARPGFPGQCAFFGGFTTVPGL